MMVKGIRTWALLIVRRHSTADLPRFTNRNSFDRRTDSVIPEITVCNVEDALCTCMQWQQCAIIFPIVADTNKTIELKTYIIFLISSFLFTSLVFFTPKASTRYPIGTDLVKMVFHVSMLSFYICFVVFQIYMCIILWILDHSSYFNIIL